MGKVLEIIGVVLGSFGGAAAIIFWLSSWLGKVWANRILEQDKPKYEKELEAIKVELGREYLITFSSVKQRGRP